MAEDPVVTIADARRGPAVHPGTDNNIAAQMGEEELDEELDALLKGAPHLITQREPDRPDRAASVSEARHSMPAR